jgi:hypothetical protein
MPIFKKKKQTNKNKLFPSSELKMETVCSFKTLAPTNESAWHQNPEEKLQHPHNCENLKFHIRTLMLCHTM